MRVQKRNGTFEEVSFDKVLNRLAKLSKDISVDHFEVAKKVCNRIYDGVLTNELDELAANICSSMIVDNPEYDQLASRVSISNHHKKTSDKFSDTIEKLFNCEKTQLISDEVHDVVRRHGDVLDSKIDYERDYLFDYFGFKTLERSYLLTIDGKPVERPQDMWMRVSIGIHGDNIEKVCETYDGLSLKLFTHATPTLFNFGTKRQQGSSCFVAGTPVYTMNRGPVPIEKVEIGDSVVTHTGATKAVVQTHKNLLDGRQLFEVKVNKTPSFRVTGNHRFFSITNEQLAWKESPQWNSIEHLRVGDWMATPNREKIAGWIDERFNDDDPEYSSSKIEIDGNIFLRINCKSKVFDDIPKFVYTLGVEDDHSYAISGLIAENCFLVNMQEDSVSGMYDTLRDCALISKFAGGIGLHIHNVRANGSLIRGTNGKSTGIVPMLRVYNDAARHINQAGKRNGSFAIYIEPWHADIEAFLDLKKNHGAESERARDLFYALWVNDEFMRRVQQNGTWSLMCPDHCPGLSDVFDDGDDKRFTELYTRYETEGKYVKQVKAQDIWMKILESQIETGSPYMLYKDSCNSKSNQKNLGTIKSSNLCVASETRVFTDTGFRPIAELEDEIVKVFNGHEFSEVQVFKTASNKELLTVETVHGHQLRCTKDHEFFVQHGEEETVVRARDLVPGMKLASHRLPVIQDSPGSEEFKYAYTHGFLCGNMSSKSEKSSARCPYGASESGLCEIHADRPREFIFNDDRCQAMKFDDQKTLVLSKDKLDAFEAKLDFDCRQEYGEGSMRIALPRDMAEKYVVPVDYDLKSRVTWLSGLVDSAGSMDANGDIVICGMEHTDFLREVMMLMQTLGAKSAIVDEGRGLFIGKVALFHLKNSGLDIHFQCITPDPDEISAPVCDCVKEVLDLRQKSDTYCFTEKLRNRAIFEGVLTSQCSEIIQYTSPDEIAVCNLASICLPSYVDVGTQTFDFQKMREVVKVVCNNLNNIIDANFYPVEKARLSNMKHRPIGIGVQGLADTFLKLNLAFDSPEARQLNRRIFENIYFAALEKSCELAKRFGPYESYAGSPSSKGILQFDMWRGDTELTCDWESLKRDISEHGLRNSLVCSPMPTASTAQIMSNTESFEPIQSNIFKRKTLAGEFIIVNKHLVNELKSIGLWSENMKNQLIANNGSVQGIQELPERLREKYKTVWELKQKTIIEMAADRGRFIDQSQSMNLYFENPTYSKITKAHFFGWQSGLKTGMYYLRSKAKAETQKFSLDASMSKKNYEEAELGTEEPCESCSA